MKKIFLTAVIIALSAINVMANEVSEYCADKSYGTGNSFTRFVSNATGANLIMTKTYETVIQNNLKKELNSEFDVEVYAYGAKSLNDGIFKGITAKSKRITSPTLYMTDFKSESLCPFNKAHIKDDVFYFNENFVAKFEGKITNDDMKKMLEDKINKVSKVNVKIGGVSLFKISNPNVSIKNKRMIIETDVQYSNFVTSKNLKLKIDTALSIVDGELTFSDTKLGDSKIINTQSISSIMNYINPFNKKIKIDDYNTAEIKVKKLEFKDDEIELQGIVVIPAYGKN